jgi:hypothetical protein
LLPTVIECKPLPLPFALHFLNQTAPSWTCSSLAATQSFALFRPFALDHFPHIKNK